MGFDVRRVPEGWQHPSKWAFPSTRGDAGPYAPTDPSHRFKPLYDEDWLTAWRAYQWRRIRRTLLLPLLWLATILGLKAAFAKSGWPHIAPGPDDEAPPEYWRFRPRWKERERTHYQLYENVSEGTPVSPPMPTQEALAEWLAEVRFTWGAMQSPMSKDQWMRVVDAGYAMSGVVDADGFTSGAEWIGRRTQGREGAGDA